jgi:hypothetical protein
MRPNRASRGGSGKRAVVATEILARARQTLDEAEFLAHVRASEATGGVQREEKGDIVNNRAERWVRQWPGKFANCFAI